MNNLQKRISQLEGDLDQAQTQLDEATQKLENTEKQLANVSTNLQKIDFILLCERQHLPNKYAQLRNTMHVDHNIT